MPSWNNQASFFEVKTSLVAPHTFSSRVVNVKSFAAQAKIIAFFVCVYRFNKEKARKEIVTSSQKDATFLQFS
jgi:hypothetical protein